MNVNIDNGADYNERGVTPNIGMSAEDEAESTTKATVSEGEIEIRDKENQKQDLAGLNRNTQNALNKLGEIFDKDSIEERQELAGLFGELAYNQIHFMEDTDEQKAAYHALVGGIMAELTNGDFLAGASAAAVNKLVVEEINKIADGDPAMAQWLSTALGAVITGDKSGASIAASGTKNNDYGKRPEYTKENGYYIYIPGKGWFVSKNGEDVYTETIPPEGVPYWAADDENAELGWDYMINDIGINEKIDDKILYSRYVEIDNEVYGITIYTNNDKKRKAIIKQGMILLGGALTAKTSSGLGSIFAVKDDVDIRKGIDSVQFTFEQIVNSLEDIIVIKSKR